MTTKRSRVIDPDKVFDLGNYALLTIVLLITIYPLIYVVSSSLSSVNALLAGKVWLYPVEFSIEGYTAVFKSQDILRGYTNSIFYAGVGTAINVVMTVLAAYPLSRADLKGRNFVMFLFAFTLFFNGGLIPTFLLVKDLGMLNTRWALIIPNALAVFNVIITRTYFSQTIPHDFLESSRIEGCTNYQFLMKIVLPLSKPILAVIALYYAVGHWNSYFNALIYINDKSLQPLQMVLRDILVTNTSVDSSMMADAETMAARALMGQVLKYSVIVVGSLPMLIIYPFVQKYFVKGVMMGAIKG